MIVVYKNGKRLKDFPELFISKLDDVKIIYEKYIKLTRDIAYLEFTPIHNEEPMSKKLRNSGFILKSY